MKACHHGTYENARCLNCEMERDKLRIAELEAALRSLRNETHGAMYAYEPEIRQVIGNTNFQCIEQRLAEADRVLGLPVETKADDVPSYTIFGSKHDPVCKVCGTPMSEHPYLGLPCAGSSVKIGEKP